MLPCVLFEDDHLLVVNKPAGLNTHAPGEYAGEGLYEWLRDREPRWAKLAIIHRLDKETSGVMLFGKTVLANRSLTEQFTRRLVKKKYVLLTDRQVEQPEFTVRSALIRVGPKYVSRPLHAGGELAETHFQHERSSATHLAKAKTCQLFSAEPLTGRTHQIRVHAADKGLPILGDVLYGGTPADRVYLHAAEIGFVHPATSEAMRLEAPIEFSKDPGLQLRRAVIEPEFTNAFRLVHSASDGWEGWYVDRVADYLLSQSEASIGADQSAELGRLLQAMSARGAYHKILTRQRHGGAPQDSSVQKVLGEAAPARFTILENGLKFELSFVEGYSAGLFLDQRDNRRRVLGGHVAAGFSLWAKDSPTAAAPAQVLNLFAYTCGFSLCAAKAGAQTTSIDLSKKYLEWGKHNFGLNDVDLSGHAFLRGDAFNWLARLAKKSARFDLILLDPPTFSRSRESGVFQAQKDYASLVGAALPLLKAGGVLFASTNAADWPPEKFVAAVESAVQQSRRKVVQRHYAPQPPDFPVSRAEPAYLKTIWLRVE